jgi:lysophospholipase
MIQLLAALLFVPSAHAIPEKDYAGRFEATVAPYARDHFVAGFLEGAKGIRVAYRKSRVEREKGLIVFAPGMGEGAFRYPELAYDLAQLGWSFYVLDPRGQGASDRLVSPIRSVYVESYDDYVEDLHRFVEQVVRPEGHPKTYLLTNSMGGLVGALELAAHPEDFRAAALSVPMFGFDLGGITEEQAYQLTKSMVAQGRGAEYAVGEGAPDLSWRPDPRSRHGHDSRLRQMMEYLEAHPAEACGGASIRWVLESIVALRRERAETPGSVPTLVLQGGRDETVPPGPQRAYCDRAADCRLERFKEGSHSLLTEDDAVRDAVLARVLGFFSEN